MAATCLYFSVSSVHLSEYLWIWFIQRIPRFNPWKHEIYTPETMKHSTLYKTIPWDQTCLCEADIAAENQWSLKTEEPE
jgi:hypothetical protein